MEENEYIKEENFNFINETENQIELKYRYARPGIMKTNLNKKKLRCGRFTLSNTSVPLFIGEPVTDDAYFNVIPNAVNDSFKNLNHFYNLQN